MSRRRRRAHRAVCLPAMPPRLVSFRAIIANLQKVKVFFSDHHIVRRISLTVRLFLKKVGIIIFCATTICSGKNGR